MDTNKLVLPLLYLFLKILAIPFQWFQWEFSKCRSKWKAFYLWSKWIAKSLFYVFTHSILMHEWLQMCLQAAVYSPQMASYYCQQMYGPTSPTNVGPSPYHHHYSNLGLGYSLQSPRAGFPSLPQGPRTPLMQYPASPMEGLFIPSQLHAPQHAATPLNPAQGDCPEPMAF